MFGTQIFATAAMVDRVILTINNIPYTQTQIERFIDVKESLRDHPETAQIVNESNWGLAIDAFITDMSIHQEASKSSGFRPTRETVQKLRLRSESSIAAAPALKSAFDRLGINRTSIETEILRVSTVENYRRGRSNLNGKFKDTAENWEKELKDRTIVRFFDDARVWKTLDTKL
jgi:hypothetical protein